MRIAWLWLKAHRWPSLVMVCAVVVAIGVVVGRQVLPVPSLQGYQVAVPLVLLLPVVLGCVVGLHSRNPTELFDVVPRSHVAGRLNLVLCLVVTVSVACLALPEPMAALRNTLGLAGLALMTSAVAGATRSWTLPVFFAMACLLLGARSEWAFLLADRDDSPAAVSGCGLLAAGALLYIVRGPRAEAAN